jgi:hypothetical protein
MNVRLTAANIGLAQGCAAARQSRMRLPRTHDCSPVGVSRLLAGADAVRTPANAVRTVRLYQAARARPGFADGPSPGRRSTASRREP